MISGAETRRSALLPGWALGAAVVILGLQCVAFHDVRLDDAFISYRYAQNLATGHGLVFNPGEKLMGSTSPGHVLLSALLYVLVGRDHLPSVASAIGCVGWVAQALALLVILRRALALWAAALVSLAIAAGAACSAEFVSLETNLAMALLLWAVAMALESRWQSTAVLASLAGLFRPDMYMPALLLAALCVHDLRARALKPALLFVAISGPWFLFAASYFGRLHPQSATSKFQRMDLLPYALFEVKLPASLVLPFEGGPAGVAAAWGLAFAGGVLLARRDRLWLLPVITVLHFAAYLYLRPYIRRWHVYPANVLFAAQMLVAVVTCVGAASRFAVARYAGASALALLVVLYGYRSVNFARTQGDAFWFSARDRVYRQVAAYLRDHGQPSQVVGAVEVGTIAYYSGHRMYDWAAITTPDPVAWPQDPKLSWAVTVKMDTNWTAFDDSAVREFKAGQFRARLHRYDATRGREPVASKR